MEEPPQDYKTAGIMMVVAGVFNMMLAATWGLIWLSTLIFFFVSFIYVIPFLIAIGELVIGIMMLTGKRVPNSMVVSIFGLISSIMMCGWIGMIMEILAIVFSTKPEVKEWLNAE